MDRDVPLGPPASMLSIAPLVQDFFHLTPPVARPQNDNNIKYGSTRADTRELQSGAGFFPPTVPNWAFSLAANFLGSAPLGCLGAPGNAPLTMIMIHILLCVVLNITTKIMLIMTMITMVMMVILIIVTIIMTTIIMQSCSS